MTTKEQLFADLKKDGISNYKDQITKANNEDGDAMFDIGWEYYRELKYAKAMAWYRLSAVKNNPKAQSRIGYLYYHGKGVSQDYLLAMEWYLKAAIQNNKEAWGSIGSFFEYGRVVPVNEYKALEWCTKSGEHPRRIKEWADKGIQLTQQDKNKSIEQLIMETEDAVWEERRMKENKLKEEISTSKQLVNKMEEETRARNNEIKSLKEEVQKCRAIAEDKQQELDMSQESIEQYKRKEQTIENELLALKQENHTLKMKLEEETHAKNNEISSLKEEVQSLRLRSEHQQQELDVNQESIEQYKRKEQTMNNEVQSMKQANHAFWLKMETKDTIINALQSENKFLRTVSENSMQGKNKREEELEKLIERELQLKDDQVALMKEKMEMSLEKEKQKRNEIQRRYQAIKRELENVNTSTLQNSSLKKSSIKNNTNDNSGTRNMDNDADYDTECDNNNSYNNDINYDTPSDDSYDEDNNDLNYDSGE